MTIGKNFDRTNVQPVAVEQPASQRSAIEIEILAKQALIDNLARQYKTYEQEEQEKLKNDPVAMELEKALSPLQKEAEQKRANPQAYSQDDILRADEAVFAGRARLLERQQQFSEDDQVTKWLRWEQISQSAQLAELRVRANFTSDRTSLFDTEDGNAASASASHVAQIAARDTQALAKSMEAAADQRLTR
jgi:hypothetical protein